jgi:hypothetical protein
MTNLKDRQTFFKVPKSRHISKIDTPKKQTHFENPKKLQRKTNFKKQKNYKNPNKPQK